MKKRHIFLLLMAVVLAGFMFAGSAHPPGVLSLDDVMSEYGGDGFAVASDTVPADMLFEQPAGFLALPDFYMIDVPAGQPQCYPLIEPVTAIGQRVFIPPSRVITDCCCSSLQYHKVMARVCFAYSGFFMTVQESCKNRARIK